MSFYLLIHKDIIVIFCLLHLSRLLVFKIKVWHSIEQCTINASTDQWCARLKSMHTCQTFWKHVV